MGSYFNNTCNRKVTFFHSPPGLFWDHDFLTCFRVSHVGCTLTVKPLWFLLPSCGDSQSCSPAKLASADLGPPRHEDLPEPLLACPMLLGSPPTVFGLSLPTSPGFQPLTWPMSLSLFIDLDRRSITLFIQQILIEHLLCARNLQRLQIK